MRHSTPAEHHLWPSVGERRKRSVGGAIEVFAREVGGDDFRMVFDQTLPPGYFERWVEAADTRFQSELPSLQSWEFTHEDAARITQPVLNMVGANTRAYFREVHDAIRTWLPKPRTWNCLMPRMRRSRRTQKARRSAWPPSSPAT